MRAWNKVFNMVKRAWRVFTCDHANTCISIVFEDSTDICICQGCGCVMWVMNDNDKRHNQHKKYRMSI